MEQRFTCSGQDIFFFFKINALTLICIKQRKTGASHRLSENQDRSADPSRQLYLPGHPWTSSSNPSASAWACETGLRCRPAASPRTASPWSCHPQDHSFQTGGGHRTGGKDWVTEGLARFKPEKSRLGAIKSSCLSLDIIGHWRLA